MKNNLQILANLLYLCDLSPNRTKFALKRLAYDGRLYTKFKEITPAMGYELVKTC